MAEDGLGGYHVGSAEVDIVPSGKGFKEKLKAELGDQSVPVRADLDDKAAKAELDELTRDRKVNVEVDKRSLSDVGLLSTTIIGLAPALAPVGAAALAAGSAFVGMAGAGILAVKGIQAEMKVGTPAGKQYSDMLATLQGDLTGLEQTAAKGVLAGFTSAAGEAEAAMPSLNAEVGILARDLGSVLGPATSGVIGLFHDLTPVVNELATDAGHVAQEFSAWANGPGGAKFAGYMAQVLPEVGAAIQGLVQAGAHLVSALLPLGTTVLNGIDALSGAISALPVPVIQAFFEAFLAYKAIDLATVALGRFSTAAKIASAAGGGVKFGGGASGLLKAVGSSASVGGALGFAGAAVGGIGIGALLGQAADAHGTKIANQAGAAIAAGGLPAYQAAQAQAASYGTQLVKLTAQQQAAAKAGGAQETTALRLGTQIQQLSVKQGYLERAISAATPAIKAQEAANVAAGLTADGTKNAITGETVATQKLVSAQDAAAGSAQGVVGANIAVHQAVADAEKALKANGKTLDLNTQKGRDNATALLNIASATRTKIDQDAADGKSQRTLNTDLSEGYTQLYNMARQFGLSKAAAQRYADSLLGIPKTVTTTIQVHLDAAAAKAKLADLLAHLPSGYNVTPPHAYGGEIFGQGGPRTDNLLTPSSPGEFMIQEPAAKAIGYGVLNKLNQTGSLAGLAPPSPNYISASSARASSRLIGSSARTGPPGVSIGVLNTEDPRTAVREIEKSQRQAYHQYQLAGV